jgi:hypothetical protein
MVVGAVISNTGAALPGVTVLQKGTANGQSTGANGKFSISLPAEPAMLHFSFVGIAATPTSGLGLRCRMAGAIFSMLFALLRYVALSKSGATYFSFRAQAGLRFLLPERRTRPLSY